MHGGVDASAQQLILDFLGEEPFAFQLPQRAVDLRIAARLDDDQLGGHALARQGLAAELVVVKTRGDGVVDRDRNGTRLNLSHLGSSYAVLCFKNTSWRRVLL